MRRGLIAWSEAELPRTTFAERVARTQAALGAHGLDALVVYTNHTRPAAGSWLTGFIPYWSEGALVLGRTGEPQLVVALSKRVQGWIETTSCAGSVTSTPRLATELAHRAVAGGPAVGVLEAATLPTGLADALAAAGATVRDASALFDELRQRADGAEVALSRRAAAIAAAALATVTAEAREVAPSVGAIERVARRDGAEEVLISVAPDLRARTAFLRPFGTALTFADLFGVRITVAYKGHWVRATRTIARRASDVAALDEAETRFAAALRALPATTGLDRTTWSIEGTTRSQPLETLASSSLGSSRDVRGKIASVSMIDTSGALPVALGRVVHVDATGGTLL